MQSYHVLNQIYQGLIETSDKEWQTNGSAIIGPANGCHAAYALPLATDTACHVREGQLMKRKAKESLFSLFFGLTSL
jgi:hypothetical protein